MATRVKADLDRWDSKLNDLYNIEQLRPNDEEDYERLVKISKTSMLYHSVKWKRLLEAFTETKPIYIVARMNGEIVGALPAFIKKGKYGSVLNSLPFYGSNGGPITHPHLNTDETRQLKTELLSTFKKIGAENHCITSTLITSVFDDDIFLYDDVMRPDFVDSRIEHITEFKPFIVDVDKELLYGVAEKRCRVAIRKAQKSGITTRFAEDLRDFATFYELHKSGIETKMGIYKPARFFDLAFKTLTQNRDFKLLFAELNGEIIAACLLFYHKNMVEYYTPAFKLEYSSLQPLSLLIFEGMKDAIKNGYTMWNFGGTWHSQQGVLQFKRAWGPKQSSYYYYINCYRDSNSIRSLPAETLLSEYKWFYVIPFSCLKASRK